MRRHCQTGVVVGFAGILLFTAGCATKKFLQEAISPVQNQVNGTQAQLNTVQKQSDQNREAIGDLDRNVAATSEKALEAARKAQEAADAAARANAAAAEAARQAEAANLAARKVDRDLDRSMQNLSNFRQTAAEQIFFRVNRSVLDHGESDKLDALVQKLNGLKGYIVEIEGFADSRGDRESNLKLSQQRADAVVHYLSVEHDIPVRSIRQLGVGSQFPGADNATPAARKNNRRVEVKVYSRDLAEEASTSSRTAQ
jgi:outer membrane protein OmpA-like peptidoglycan-associated protein